MNEATSKRMVLVSVTLLAVLASVRKAQGDTGSLYKRLWGIGVIGVLLSVTADFAPTVAGPFAVLTLLGSLTNGGDKAITNVLASVSSKLPQGPTPQGGGSVPHYSGTSAPASTTTPPSSAPGYSGSPQHTP